MLAPNLIVIHPPVQKGSVVFAQNSLASLASLYSLQLQLTLAKGRWKPTNYWDPITNKINQLKGEYNSMPRN